jgi:hypothetical protein
MRLSERIYRILVKAYPARYRSHYERPMVQLFSDLLRSVNSPGALIRLWFRTSADLLGTIPARHFERLRPHGLFNFYNDAARRSIFFARYEAEGFGHDCITPEHVLLGVVRQDREIRGWLSPAALDEIRRAIAANGESQRRSSRSVCVPLNEACKQILSLALRDAERSGVKQITPRHVVAAILSDGQTLAAELLRRYGIDLDRVRLIQ